MERCPDAEMVAEHDTVELTVKLAFVEGEVDVDEDTVMR